MTRAITYTLFLEEPCLLTKPGGDPNTESSLSHIPGGALRGALAARYLSDGGQADSTFNDLFLNGKVRYLNAYPLLNGARTLPTPRAWTKLKDEGDAILDRTDANDRVKVEAGIPKSLREPFVRPTNKALVEPEMEIAVHTSRNRAKGRAIEGDADSALFRYEALARGQAFAGIILLNDGTAALADTLTGLLGDRLLLGGSHMAGYGLTSVNVQSLDEQPARWREAGGAAVNVAIGASFIVYLASDAILRDPATGGPTSDVRAFLPGGPDGYIIEHAFATSGWVGGFNKQWGLPLAQQWAVLMGSTWVIKTDNGLTAKEVRDLEQQGIGARTEEGFGRLIITPADLSPWRQGGTAEGDATAPTLDPTPADDRSQKLLSQMNKRITQAALDRYLVAAVNKKADKKNVRGHLSRSQLGRLQVRIRRAAEEENLPGFVRYLEETHKRKSADDQFRKFAVGGKNFRDELHRLAATPQSIWVEFLPTVEEEEEIDGRKEKWKRVEWTPPKIGLDTDAFDYRSDEVARDYTIRYIANLCRQLSKQEGES